ncbi:MAG: helix-turn-helix domain-containing protein [Lachnospiraceae bacterium]|nr:helix-turn-helix domain-containing protein [Lachnospiraceae bacterium]
MLTATDVKERLGIGINKARALMKLKDFPAIRLGGTIRVPEDEFEAWIHNSVGMTFDV